MALKEKRFGNVFAFEFKENGNPTIGVSIAYEKPSDVFDGEWIRLAKAKKLHESLGKAIAYIESHAPRGEKEGGG